LPSADRKLLAEVAEVRSFDPGETLFLEGEPSRFFYSIVSGRVKVFKSIRSGQDIILGIFSAADPVGSVAVFKEVPYPASAQALTQTVCIGIARKDLYTLLEHHPSLARGLLLGLTQRLVELINRVDELTGARVEHRLARLLLRLAKELGRSDQGAVFIPLALSRQELADMTGTTIETCIRIMSRWEKEDTVHTQEDGFVLLDAETLETLAQI
jgi:CRP/FNR family transcriptional regulator